MVKDKGHLWDGAYFRHTILIENVIPFLKDDQNVVSAQDNAKFVHKNELCLDSEYM